MSGSSPDVLHPSSRARVRVCGWCGGPIPSDMRSDARYCCTSHRQAAHRFAPRGLGVVSGLGTDGMRFAYADPPYVGKSDLYRGHPDYAGEVNVPALVDSLRGYDGWALSCSADSLGAVLRVCPSAARVAVWVRGSRHSRSLRPSNGYEPVVYCGGRAVASSSRTDVLIHGVVPRSTDSRRVIGAKPAAFCYWLFSLLGAGAGDSLDDLFPGSGGVARAWELYQAELSRSVPVFEGR